MVRANYRRREAAPIVCPHHASPQDVKHLFKLLVRWQIIIYWEKDDSYSVTHFIKLEPCLISESSFMMIVTVASQRLCTWNLIMIASSSLRLFTLEISTSLHLQKKNHLNGRPGRLSNKHLPQIRPPIISEHGASPLDVFYEASHLIITERAVGATLHGRTRAPNV